MICGQSHFMLVHSVLLLCLCPLLLSLLHFSPFLYFEFFLTFLSFSLSSSSRFYLKFFFLILSFLLFSTVSTCVLSSQSGFLADVSLFSLAWWRLPAARSPLCPRTARTPHVCQPAGDIETETPCMCEREEQRLSRWRDKQEKWKDTENTNGWSDSGKNEKTHRWQHCDEQTT